VALFIRPTRRQIVGEVASDHTAIQGIRTVHHYMLESELLHLERIIARSPQKHFPPTYWRDRVEHLGNYRHASMYRDRIARLVRLVGELSA
jgi:hypothetical protein